MTIVSLCVVIFEEFHRETGTLRLFEVECTCDVYEKAQRIKNAGLLLVCESIEHGSDVYIFAVATHKRYLTSSVAHLRSGPNHIYKLVREFDIATALRIRQLENRRWQSNGEKEFEGGEGI